MIKKLLVVFIVMFSVWQSGMVAYADDDYYYDEEETQVQEITPAEQAYRMGVSLVQSKAYESAINAFKEAISLNPQMTDAYYNIAAIYVAQKKYDEAYDIYVKILAINPRDYDSILQAAKISYNRKNYSLALKYLKYIPSDYDYYYVAEQLIEDAKEMLNVQVGKIERSKMTVANRNQTVLLDNFNTPAGIVVDNDGNMYVACYSDNVIIKVDENKRHSNFVKDYLLDGPIGLAIDRYDNIYVANYDGNNILKITKNGNVSIFMEKVSHPYFLYIKDDILYISEQGNDVILKYNLAARR